jgi:hypothetical protein
MVEQGTHHSTDDVQLVAFKASIDEFIVLCAEQANLAEITCMT